jgi:inorganic triphosphatase YgiF
MLDGKALKLATTIDDLPQVKQALRDLASQGHEARTTLTSTYYDTAAGRLKREGLVLCVDEQNRRYIQAVKAHRVTGATSLERGEWEHILAADQPDLRAPNGGGPSHAPRETELQARFTTVVRRTRFTLEPDASTGIEGALDEGEITTVGSERTEPISELALELKRGDPGALYGIALRLLEASPLRLEIRSEAERGYSLLEAASDKPDAGGSLPFDLKPDMTVEEALQGIGWGCLTTLLRNERAALADMPEGVHQMRVAVRRLRSAVNAVKRMLPPAQYEWVSRELKWLSDVLSPARNWDVVSNSLLAPVRSALLGEQDLNYLCHISEIERRSAHEKANAAIRSEQYTAAVLKLSQWFASCSWRDQRLSEQSTLLMAPIGAVAPTLIARRYHKVKKAADGFGELTLEQRHKVRIAIKKLRYTIELLKDLFEADTVAEFVGRLKPLQDDLGHANDVSVANELMASLQVSDNAAGVARAAGIVLGWHDRGLADRDRKLRKRVRKLRRARPFW